MNTKERVIQYLLSKERRYTDNCLCIEISRKSFSESNIAYIGEGEFINQLSFLETDGLVTVRFRTGYRDLTYSITIVLRSPIINYFENKRKEKIAKRNNWIQFWIPISLSAIAIIVSIIAL